MGEPRNMPGGNSNILSVGVLARLGAGEFRPLEDVGGPSLRPADRWNLDSLLTTRGVVWVLTPTGPPYGEMGKMCVVPRSVETATHLESGEKAMSWTEPGVSPR